METSVIHHAGWFFFYVLRVLSVILYKVSINNVAHWNVFITEHKEYTNVYAARVRNPAGERIANLKVDIVVRNRKCNILNQEEARGWIIFLLLVCVCACVWLGAGRCSQWWPFMKMSLLSLQNYDFLNNNTRTVLSAYILHFSNACLFFCFTEYMLFIYRT